MNTSSDARNPVELLAEDFLERKRRGERPMLQEYLDRHPELAEEIRDLFPALLMMEDLGESSGGTTGSLAADDGLAVAARLERLGDYRILREIGRGGMGVVYEAEQESLGRRVALKVLSAGSLLDPKQVRRFEREAKAAARLHHTNIVPVFGVGRQDGHHYFVMQFIAGVGLDVVLEDLRRLRGPKPEAAPAAGRAAASRVAGLSAAEVARSLMTGRFAADGPPGDGSATEPFNDAAPAPPAPANGPPVDADSSSVILPGSSELSASSDPDRQFYRSIARIGIQVAEALEYANRQGILHRDVKPSNLLLDNHGNVWVADFGLAKTGEADDLTHTGDILGTIRYMAPERFAGHCDARSDVYSLGLTLYELVALRPAYEASDRHSLMDRVLHEEPERLKRLAPGVPRDLETIVAKATARDPALRYATAAALAEDLRRYVEDRPIRARRISPVERLARWCKRNPVIAGSLGLAALALVAVAVMALLHARRQAEANRQIARLARDLGERGRSLESSLAESNRRLAMLYLERGRALCEKGQVGVGLLWFLRSLRTADAAGDEAGRRVASANLAAWRAHNVELKGVFSNGAYTSEAAFSPDAKTIVTIGSNTARRWDAASGRPIGPSMKHQGAVFAVAFSPDGQTILTGSQDKTARRWDAASGRPIGQAIEHAGSDRSVAFSPDGTTVLTRSSDRTMRLWDATSGRLVRQLMEHAGSVLSVAFSPDGQTILTGSQDGTARRWDADTGKPIGPPMVHPRPVISVAFSPDGQTIVAAVSNWFNTGVSQGAQAWDAATGQPFGPPMTEFQETMIPRIRFTPDGHYVLMTDLYKGRIWDAPAPLPGDPPRLAAWIESATGLELDDRDEIRVLDGDAWRDRRRRLEQLGGPPPDPAPRRDPILFGVQPEARGDALAERGLWDQAEAAYAEAAEARPLSVAFSNWKSVWGSLTRLHLSRGHPERAVCALSAAVSRWPDSLELREWQCRALLVAGDRVGWERAIASLLDRFPGPMSPHDSNTVAWVCSLGPSTIVDRESPIRLAQAGVRDAPVYEKANGLNTLGAALYRACRYDEAIRRLEEAIQARLGGQRNAADWVLLAMAHHRLGHREKARRWLDRLADDRSGEDPQGFPVELEIGLLRSEAEGMILYDPVFPDDPFAH